MTTEAYDFELDTYEAVLNCVDCVGPEKHYYHITQTVPAPIWVTGTDHKTKQVPGTITEHLFCCRRCGRLRRWGHTDMKADDVRVVLADEGE